MARVKIINPITGKIRVNYLTSEVTEIICIVFDDNSVGRMQFFDDPTDENIQMEIDKGVWKNKPINWFRTNNFPVLFRDAWISDGKSINIHMGKALEIKKNQLRAQRDFSSLDIAYTKADEQQDLSSKKYIANKKQILRDVTKHPKLLSASTPEELDSITLQDLGVVI